MVAKSPSPISKKKEKVEKQRKDEDTPVEEDVMSEVADLEPIEVHVVPDDQIKGLTEEQLNEEFTKALNANNPQAPANLILFDFASGQFQPMPPTDHINVLFCMDDTLVYVGNSNHQQSEEASEALPSPPGPGIENGGIAVPESNRESKVEEEGAPSTGIQAPPVPPDSPNTQRAKVLKNQFNFSERASQTFNNPCRDRMVATEPPPTASFTSLCTQYILFDAYLAAFREGKEAKAQKDQTTTRKQRNENDGDPVNDLILADVDKGDDISHKVMSGPNMSRAVKLMERIVNLNAEEEIFYDFKYFEEEADKSRDDGVGFFLPLWRFSYAKTKRKTVTDIKWNMHYPDLFAVAYGSYDFMSQQGSGMICCYTLKNTSHPEFSFTTTSGVMCIAFHPQHPALLAVGLYDGSVCVYDIRSKENRPIYQSLDPKVKHTDPVWGVYWQNSDYDIGKEINFFSISSDGRVTDWLMSKNELINEEIMQLKLISRKSGSDQTFDDERAIGGLASGTCFDFNPFAEHLFVIGTDEGSIHTCSKAYNSQYLNTFAGHHMAVYAVKWNPFHRGVFLSCSADWTVRMWESSNPEPLLTFDLGSPVGDIAWAPYSSTVFAAVTAEGKIFLFDLNVNKNEAIGQQRIVKKGKLTHVVFNMVDPILMVGDDRGSVMSLKLSPNLRRISAKTVKDIKKEQEIAKLESIMAIAAKKESFV